jgi:hypothetical protein
MNSGKLNCCPEFLRQILIYRVVQVLQKIPKTLGSNICVRCWLKAKRKHLVSTRTTLSKPRALQMCPIARPKLTSRVASSRHTRGGGNGNRGRGCPKCRRRRPLHWMVAARDTRRSQPKELELLRHAAALSTQHTGCSISLKTFIAGCVSAVYGPFLL